MGTVVLRSPMTILAPQLTGSGASGVIGEHSAANHPVRKSEHSNRDGCSRLGPHCAPNIAVNIVNRIFTFFDEDRSPDNSDGISIEPPMQSAMDSAIALRPE
jgi:hypothetical protein